MNMRIGDFREYGTNLTSDGMMFTFSTEGDLPCSILLYDIKSFKLVEEVTVLDEFRIGNVYSLVLIKKGWNKLCYRLKSGKNTFVDPYAKIINGRDKWNDKSRFSRECLVYGGFDTSKEYLWKNSKVNIEPKDLIIYKLHMRGFTMNHGLKTSEKGNYKGLLTCIHDVKKMGFNAIEIQPMYDFEELRFEMVSKTVENGRFEYCINPLDKVNFWGYDGGYYMAPKASYFGGKDAISNCKKMVDEIHGMGMEVIMEISFSEDCQDDYIIDCMWHWVKNFKVDGFHLLGVLIPIEEISKHPGFADTKIFYDNIPDKILLSEKNSKHMFVYNNGFQNVTRQIQNHMQGSMTQFANFMRRQNSNYGFVNYVANSNGFTLFDSVSYGEKHNEDNGEFNRDGDNINFSFNNGVEGKTKNKQINSFRLQQMRNALSTMFLSQAVPLLRSGDEVLNTQNGNNNPYCQDNAIGWVQYSANSKAKEAMKDFVKKLITFRQNHQVLSQENPMKMTDYKHIGMPDLSYHGWEPWLMFIGEELKAIGMLYVGEYVDEKENVYVAYNFHYDQVELALPKVSCTKEWKLIMNTAEEESMDFKEKCIDNQQSVVIPGNSISIYTAKNTKLKK
ncbi:MAG: hypothetical protein K6B67_01760 [Lachnospiraceae bacterium]|nr:hypothetical protein [Lachnospiraceae bacterium]